MKLKQLSALTLAASTIIASPAMAWESADGQHATSASVALSTDYMWRGASQTDNEAALSGSFDYNHASGLYAGVWASNVDIDGRNGQSTVDIEIDGYFGFANEIQDTGIGYDVGFMRYFFPGEDHRLDWNEVYLGLSYSYFSVKISHSADAAAQGEDATHYLFGANYDLPMGVELHANYAIYDFDDVRKTNGLAANVVGIDNTLEDWNIGVTKDFVGFTFDLTYYDTLNDAEELGRALNNGNDDSRLDDRVVFTISKSL